MGCNACEQKASLIASKASWYDKLKVLFKYLRTIIWSPKVSQRVYAKRMVTCMGCDQTVWDGNGKPTTERLARSDRKGNLYCGAPRLSKIHREEVREGCGCPIASKARYADSECPRVMWGPGDKFNPRYVVDIKNKPKVHSAIIDVYVPAKTNSTDNHGMGDTVMALPVALALQRDNPDKLVRIRLKEGNFQWLRAFGWHHYAPLDDNDLVGKGEREVWLTEFSNTFTDLEALKRGTTRLMQWAERADVKELAFPNPPIKLSVIEKEVSDKIANIRALGGKIALLAPFSHGAMRTWPLVYWLQLQQELAAKKVFSIIVDSPGDGSRLRLFPTFKLWGLSPEYLLALASQADVIVANDSGLAHIGGLLKKPTIAVCSATDGKTIFGSYPTVEVVQAEGSCTACYWKVDRGWRHECQASCELMLNQKPEKVSNLVLNAIKEELVNG